RLALPLGVCGLGLGLGETLLLSLLGNLLPIPVLYFALRPLERASRRLPALDRALQWIYAHTKRKSAVLERYGPVGLVTFVAIPLPGTGAWTGAIAAYLLGMPLGPAMAYLAAGVLGAGLMVSGILLLLPRLFAVCS
ncbi:MAG: small multi-drug export protein, partial [Deinococcus sp.]|nr:small multi-drug export protein [Deinococcus sp.]